MYDCQIQLHSGWGPNNSCVGTSIIHNIMCTSSVIIYMDILLYRCQKTSLWSWLLGSISTITLEGCSLSDGSEMSVTRQDDEDEEAWSQRRAGLLAKMQKKVLVLAHAILQVRHLHISPACILQALMYTSERIKSKVVCRRF